MPKRAFTINDRLDTNEEGLGLIKRCERFMSRWYLCPAGVWTIGFGTTENSLPGVNRQMLTGPIDEVHADQLLRRGLISNYEPAIERHGLELTSNAFSALASFVFNIGPSAFAGSTLLKKLKAGDLAGAADELLRWVHADGEVLGGLVKRRQAERALFLEEPEPVRKQLVARLEKMPVLSVDPLPYNRPEVPKLLENPYDEPPEL